MNKSSKILVIQLICMYLIHVPLYLGMILAYFANISDDTIRILLIVGFAAMLLMIPVCIISFIFACLNLVGNESGPLKTALTVKLGLIPWYIINFIICTVWVAGFLNPWLMIAIPLFIGIEVCITYIFMLSTSIHSVTYAIRLLTSRKIKPNCTIIIAIVFHFILCLDIIGAIMLKKEIEKSDVK